MEIDRTFRDINGIEWRVSVSPDDSLAPNAEGCLSFAAGWMERRLSPVPKGWERVTIQRLEQMCRIANPVQRERSTIGSSHSADAQDDAAMVTADAPVEAASAEVIGGLASLSDHVSRLVNVWPAAERRVIFRG